MPPCCSPEPSGAGLAVEGLGCLRDDEWLFRGLAFDIGPGDIVQFDGPNGCGKTSLLRILCGLSRPDEGRVCWDGLDIQTARAGYVAELAWVGHAHGVKDELTAAENLAMAAALGRPRPETPPAEALERFGLAGYERVPARRLSAGQRRRVALARLLVTGARLWILDEPFTAIDRDGVRMIHALLSGHVAGGGMVAMTSHHPVDLTFGHVQSIHLRNR